MRFKSKHAHLKYIYIYLRVLEALREGGRAIHLPWVWGGGLGCSKRQHGCGNTLLENEDFPSSKWEPANVCCIKGEIPGILGEIATSPLQG